MAGEVLFVFRLMLLFDGLFVELTTSLLKKETKKTTTKNQFEYTVTCNKCAEFVRVVIFMILSCLSSVA
jgi:hypothetical protein